MASEREKLIGYIVDDEPMIASSLEIVLIMQGFEAKSFVRPSDVLAAVRSSPPDILIADVIMPEMNGFELAAQVTELRPDCKVLLFSGQHATESLHETMKAQGRDYMLLAKPIHPNDLMEKIRELMGQAST